MAINSTALSLALFAAIISCTRAAEFGGGSVLHLSSSDFAEKTADGGVWFIKFYAPWCGHCKKLAPTWRELANTYEGIKDVNIAHVDCTTDKEVCSKYEVKGYPTLKMFFDGEEYTVYKGQRDVPSFKKFIDKSKEELFSETTA